MPGPSSQPWTRASSIRRRIGYAHPDLRVSDAERADVADRLGKHYADGRLDQAEFNERVEAAMKAKTQSDLSGLFDDLPSTEPPEQLPGRRPRRHEGHRVLFVALVIVLAAAVGHSVVLPHIAPLLLIGILALIALYVVRVGERHHDHHRDHHDHQPGPPRP